MKSSARSRPSVKLIELALISLGFAISFLLYRTWFADNYANLTNAQVFARFAISVLTFWMTVQLFGGREPDDTLGRLFDQFCVGTGLNLILQAVLAYFQLLIRSFFLIVVGGLFAALLLALAARWLYAAERAWNPGTLLVGMNPTAYQLALLLRQPIVGVVGESAAALPEVPFLGEAGSLEEAVAGRHPTRIVVSPGARVAPAALLRCQMQGIEVDQVPALYQRMFHRVYCEGLQPAELLLSPALRADSRTMAIQAIYTNLIGLFFLAALSPVLLIVTIFVALFSGPGPTFEQIECLGFQKIPFQLLRFRTRRRDGSGALTPAGRVITALHLVRLPQLINVVRGEMALFGPRPVRGEFADRLTEVMPFYALRFSVKPGILGWAQVNLAREAGQRCEFREIEYDLYYIKEGSPLLDLEILIRSLFLRKGEARDAIGYARATS